MIKLPKPKTACPICGAKVVSGIDRVLSHNYSTFTCNACGTKLHNSEKAQFLMATFMIIAICLMFYLEDRFNFGLILIITAVLIFDTIIKYIICCFSCLDIKH